MVARKHSRRSALAGLAWLFVSAVALSCGDEGPGDTGLQDGGLPDGQEADAWALPPADEILDPSAYDCRRAADPPERASPLPVGCFWQQDCTGWIVVAHRGGTYFAPENTLSAVRASIALGVDMVEVDTRFTADGQLVLMHDDSVNRTTDGRGKVSDFTLDEIQSLKLVVSPDLPASLDLSCEHVPSFRELLELCKGRMDIMVDAKEGAAEAARLVQETNMVDQVVIMAGAEALQEARQTFPQVRLMVRPHGSDEVEPLWSAFDPPPDVVHLDHTFADESLVARIHSLGGKALTNVWGADMTAVFTGDLSAYLEERDMGIDLTQSEYAFLVLVAAGRLELP